MLLHACYGNTAKGKQQGSEVLRTVSGGQDQRRVAAVVRLVERGALQTMIS